MAVESVSAFVLALQLLASPCPPSLRCTIPAVARQTTPTVTTTADPGQPAKWFTAAWTIELAAFEGWALATHHNTVSHLAQRESKAHPAVRWSIVAAMAAMTWHLVQGF